MQPTFSYQCPENRGHLAIQQLAKQYEHRIKGSDNERVLPSQAPDLHQSLMKAREAIQTVNAKDIATPDSRQPTKVYTAWRKSIADERKAAMQHLVNIHREISMRLNGQLEDFDSEAPVGVGVSMPSTSRGN